MIWKQKNINNNFILNYNPMKVILINLSIIFIVFLFSSCDDDKKSLSIDKTIQDKTFWSYNCTQDCSWHKAGYRWAQKKGIDNKDDCWWNNDSFIEGCYYYVENRAMWIKRMNSPLIKTVW